MNAALPPVTVDSRELALELHGLLKQIDPARWRPDLEAQVRAHLGSLRDALRTLLPRLDPQGAFAGLHTALGRAYALLGDAVPSPSLAPRAARQAWRRFAKDLQAAYTAISKSLEAWDIHVPALRPTNYARNVFHVSWAALAIAFLGWWPDQRILLGIIVGITLAAWTMETSRRYSPRINAFLMWILGPFAHPHEAHRVNSATWYSTALLVLTSTGVLTASVIALAVLGVGDPTAAIVGRRFGRTRLVNGRSLEGTLAFVAAGIAAALPLMRWLHPEVAWAPAVLATVAGAVAGALAELYSRRIDDNLSIPLSAAAGATLVLGLFGVPA